MSNLRNQMRYLNPYDIHKLIINDYVLKKPGDTALLRRDGSKDRTDYHVIKENHRFLWDDSEDESSWELQFAKKYYKKLFKEYCIGDLCLYKENKVALRWRTEKEVIHGKGQFICGNKKCERNENLHTWEVNFAYVEQGCKKNALVKIRLCPSCSKKLNYHSKKKEIRLKTTTKKNKNQTTVDDSCSSCSGHSSAQITTDESKDYNADEANPVVDKVSESPWENQNSIDTKSRDEEMEDYLQDLLL